MIRASDRFWQAIVCIGFGEHRLPLKIRELNEVTIDNAQFPDPRARQRFSLRGTKRAAAND
jgi:hypothetical protein